MPKLIQRREQQAAPLPRASAEKLGAGAARALSSLGAQINASGQVLQAASDARARRKASEFEIALGAEAEEILQDPNLEGREQRFTASRERLKGQFRPTTFFGSTNEFDFSAGLAGDRIGSRITAQTNRDGIERGVADNDFTANQIAQAAAIQVDPSERDLLIADGVLVIGSSLANGLRSQKDHDKRIEKFHQDVNGGMLRRMSNDDPASGLKFLNEPGAFIGTEEERQVWRADMIRSIRVQTRAEEADRKRNEISTDDSAKIANDEADRQLTSLSAEDLGISVGDVLDRERQLTPERFRAWMGIAQGGGKIREPSESNRDVFIAFSTGADLGQDITNDVNSAWRAGLITKTDRDGIVSSALDNRFGAPRRSIATTLKAGLLGDPGQQNRQNQALRFFDEWRLNHPAATREDAFEKSQQLIDSAQTMLDPSDLEFANLRPTDSVMNEDGKTVNIIETSVRFVRMRDSGEITLAEYAERARMMRTISNAQEAAKRRAARSATQ